MKKMTFLLLVCLLTGATMAVSAAPSDVVPDGSGLYDAVALLAQDHLLPVGSLDAADLLGVSHRLRTRAEFAAIIRSVTQDPTDPRAQAALAYARNVLAPELGSHSGAGVGQATFGPTGFVQPTEEGRNDQGSNLKSRGYILGRGRVLGTLGRDGAYTVSVTNIYRQTRDHASFTTRGGGHEGGDSPDVLNGVDEAYATVLGSHGIRVSAGLMRRRWGAGYRGDVLVSDNAPARPSLEVTLPFYLGRTLGSYTFRQYEAKYSNSGRTIYQGGRRLEHQFGDRVTLDLEEVYNSNEFKNASVLFIPYYAYQSNAYNHNTEPSKFNYLAGGGLTILPFGPRVDARLYGQLAVDDIGAGSLGQGNRVPRKVAYLLGYAQSFPRSGTDAVLEYAHTDRATYTDQFSELAWFTDGLPNAMPVGPNGNEVFLRIGQRLTPKLSSFIALRDRHRVSDTFPAPTDRSVDLGLDYHLGASRSIGLQYSDYREDPFTGTVPPNPYGGPELPGQFGGADAGQYLRRHIIGVSFLQAF